MTEALVLPPVLDIRAAEDLKTQLLALRGRPLAIDASAVERLGGLCLQVLLSARRTWDEDGQALSVAAPSDAFAEQWAAFGAAPLADTETNAADLGAFA